MGGGYTKRRADKDYLDCVRTPMTSAYRSAMMCTFPVLGPEYLVDEEECCYHVMN